MKKYILFIIIGFVFSAVNELNSIKENNGIKNDYPRRVMRHYVEKILSQINRPNLERESKLVEEYLSNIVSTNILDTPGICNNIN